VKFTSSKLIYLTKQTNSKSNTQVSAAKKKYIFFFNATFPDINQTHPLGDKTPNRREKEIHNLPGTLQAHRNPPIGS